MGDTPAVRAAPLGWLTAAAIAAASAQAAPAAAQECTRTDDPTQLQEAIALFRAGMLAVEQLRWADAAQSLERAYALACPPSALFNLGISLRALGRHREARDAFRRLLENHADAEPEMLSMARQRLREVSLRVAVLELVGIAPDVRPVMHFDGEQVVDEGERPMRIETDAGSHSFTARIPDHHPFEWNGRLEDGETETVRVEFLELPTGGSVDLAPIIIPIVLGLAAAAGVGLGFWLQDQAQLRPLSPDRVVVLSE